MAGTKMAPGGLFIYPITSTSNAVIVDGDESVVTEADYGAYDKRIVAIHCLSQATGDKLYIQIGDTDSPYSFVMATSHNTTGTYSTSLAPGWHEDGPRAGNGVDIVATSSGEWLIVCKAV